MSNGVALRPIHYASVSGGKDSLYMLKVIFENPTKYPLDMVINFELEIDWPWVSESVEAIERLCQQVGVKFLKIRPRVKWEDQYAKWGLPSRLGRWCNSSYKLDCKRQLHKWITEQKCRPVAYIGFCADEIKRFKYQVGTWDPQEEQDVCYPLAEEGINEDQVLLWARGQSTFSGWYWIFRRQGCMICPNLSMMECAYMLKVYPQKYIEFSRMIQEYENAGKGNYFHKPWPEIDYTIRTKWTKKLEQAMHLASFCAGSLVDTRGNL